MDKEEIGNERLNRRGFLWLMAGGVVTAAATAFGCGGSGGGGGGGGTIPIGTISEAARAASLDAIVAFMNSVATQPLDQQLAAALNFVSGRPEFLRAEANDDGVWGIYPDGVALMILCNRLPDELDPSLQGGIGRAPTEVPSSINARLINTMGNAFVDELPIVGPLLAGNGYANSIDPGTVESLRTVGGDGVFYMSAHGGQCAVPIMGTDGNFVRDSTGRLAVRSEFGVWTSTHAAPATSGPYIPDLQARRLGIGVALHSVDLNGDPIFDRHYWFTREFVDHYMSFSTDSLVWFSACLGHSLMSAPFIQTCIDKGAGLYVGWNRKVRSNECVRAGRFIIDRLIGANAANPLENPPQRPFDYFQIWQDYNARGLPAGILYTAGANFGLLAPTIAYVLINEVEDEAVLYGVFGNPPANARSVLIGGIEATVNAWTNGEIRCELPRTGTGSSGNVEVWVRGHRSNVRRITEWNVPFQYSWVNTDLVGPSVAGPITLRFRADVGDYRDFPGIPPLKPERWALATRDSLASLTGSGEGTDGECIHVWAGHADYPAGGFPGGPTVHIIAARMKVDTLTNTGAIGLALGATGEPPYAMVIACPTGSPLSSRFMVTLGLLDGVQGFHSPNPDPNDPEVPLPALNVAFGSDHTIPARNFVDNSASPLQIQLSWSDVVPIAPPDPGAARSVPDRRGG